MGHPFLKPASCIKPASSQGSSSCGLGTGPKAELLIVEGKSAANALDHVRDRRKQGIFMMQGKIPNPLRANADKIRRHEQCAALIELLENQLGTGNGYNKIVIVPDADADGIHASYLLVELFRHYLRSWVLEGKLFLFRTPLARIETDSASPEYLCNPREIQHWLKKQKPEHRASLTHFKGLPSLPVSDLAELMTYPLSESRGAMRVSANTSAPENAS